MSKKWRELLSLLVVSGAKSVTKDCLVVESSLPLNRKLLDRKDGPQMPLHMARRILEENNQNNDMNMKRMKASDVWLYGSMVAAAGDRKTFWVE